MALPESGLNAPEISLTRLLATMCTTTVCVEAENKNIRHGLVTTGEHQNFLEKGKLIIGGAVVACVVSCRYPSFWHHAEIL